MLCTAICTFPSRFFARYRMTLIFVVVFTWYGNYRAESCLPNSYLPTCRVVLRPACVTRLSGTRPLGHVLHVFLAVLGLYSP